VRATRGYALFDTGIGRCAIAWNEAGIAGCALPEGDDEATRRRIARASPAYAEEEPPSAIAAAIRRIAALLAGARDDLRDLPLDLRGVPEFHRKVYERTRAIAPGETLGYGELARAIGMPGAAQAVGRALGENPFPVIVPCHRVLAADGSLHGFSAHGGIATKRRMLQIEGALVQGELGL